MAPAPLRPRVDLRHDRRNLHRTACQRRRRGLDACAACTCLDWRWRRNFLKFVVPGRLDRLSIAFFLILGAAGLIALGPLSRALPSTSFILFIVGGPIYVVGLGLYLWKGLKFQNAIWHGFVAGAAALHFAAVAMSL